MPCIARGKVGSPHNNINVNYYYCLVTSRCEIFIYMPSPHVILVLIYRRRRYTFVVIM